MILSIFVFPFFGGIRWRFLGLLCVQICPFMVEVSNEIRLAWAFACITIIINTIVIIIIIILTFLLIIYSLCAKHSQLRSSVICFRIWKVPVEERCWSEVLHLISHFWRMLLMIRHTMLAFWEALTSRCHAETIAPTTKGIGHAGDDLQPCRQLCCQHAIACQVGMWSHYDL